VKVLNFVFISELIDTLIQVTGKSGAEIEEGLIKSDLFPESELKCFDVEYSVNDGWVYDAMCIILKEKGLNEIYISWDI
jgi:hypothetical protein